MTDIETAFTRAKEKVRNIFQSQLARPFLIGGFIGIGLGTILNIISSGLLVSIQVLFIWGGLFSVIFTGMFCYELFRNE